MIQLSLGVKMYFKNRQDAGRQLCPILEKHRGKEMVIYALPRGGVVVAAEIAKFFKAPLDLIFAHKIGHPYQPEYAIGAISESGHLIQTSESRAMEEKWLENQKKFQIEEIKRKRKLYLKKENKTVAKGKIAIIVDDGIATGLTMKAAILEIKEEHPLKIVIAVPVAPESTADELKREVDDFVAITIPEDHRFLGSVGAYYEKFPQVEDEEVIAILNDFRKDGKINSYQ